MGSQNIIEAALDNKVSNVIALSTDKAVSQLIYMENKNFVLKNYLFQQIIFLEKRILNLCCKVREYLEVIEDQFFHILKI